MSFNQHMSAGMIVNINEYMVKDDDATAMVFLGAMAWDVASQPLLIFALPTKPLKEMDVKSVIDHVYWLSVKDFLEKYATNWLVSHIYNDKYQEFEAVYEDPRVSFTHFNHVEDIDIIRLIITFSAAEAT